MCGRGVSARFWPANRREEGETTELGFFFGSLLGMSPMCLDGGYALDDVK